MRTISAALFLALAVTPALAEEPDHLSLPPGFHASVVAEGLGLARHLAIRSNGDIYVSTLTERDAAPAGIIALRLDRDHKLVETEHFGTVANGTGIRIYKDALYAASPTTVYRYALSGRALAPTVEPQIVIDGMPATGFPSRGLAFDGKGGLYVTAGASSNICLDPAAPKNVPPVGLRPCPSLDVRSGVWRFDASKLNQKFSGDGECFIGGAGIQNQHLVKRAQRLQHPGKMLRTVASKDGDGDLHRVSGAKPFDSQPISQKFRVTSSSLA